MLPISHLLQICERAAAPKTAADSGSSPIDSALLDRLPPVLMTVGGSEMLRSDAERMAERLAAAGVPITLQIWRGQVHAFAPAFPFLPESRTSTAEIARFALDRTAAAVPPRAATA